MIKYKDHPTLLNIKGSKCGKVRLGSRSLKPSCNGNGYIRINRNNTTVYIHRLVAQTYVPNPKCKSQVNHIDGDKSNSNVLNLEWVTPTENVRHSILVLGKGYKIPREI